RTRIAQISRVAEETGKVLRSVLRMKIAHGSVDHLEFEAHLQAMPAHDLSEIHLGVAHERVLILRIAALPAKLRETAQPNGEKAAGKRRIGRFARNIELRRGQTQC